MERLKAVKDALLCAVESQIGNLKEVDAEELGEVVDMVKDMYEAMKYKAETEYYCTIVKSMKEAEEQEELARKMGLAPQGSKFYGQALQYPYERDMDRDIGRMYYSERQPRNSRGEWTSRRSYEEGGYQGGHNSTQYYGGSGATANSGAGYAGSSQHSSGASMNHGGGNGSRYFHEHEIPFDMRDEREGKSHMSRRMYMESKEMHGDKEKKLKELEKYMKELSEDIVEMIEDASPEEKQMLEKKMTQLTSKVAQLNHA